jgi:hypothetical protein
MGISFAANERYRRFVFVLVASIAMVFSLVDLEYVLRHAGMPPRSAVERFGALRRAEPRRRAHATHYRKECFPRV